jgi:hypothetical protein
MSTSRLASRLRSPNLSAVLVYKRPAGALLHPHRRISASKEITREITRVRVASRVRVLVLFRVRRHYPLPFANSFLLDLGFGKDEANFLWELGL